MMEFNNAQDAIKSMFEDDTNQTNETLQLLNFIKNDGTPLTENQIKAQLLINEFPELSDINELMLYHKQHVTPVTLFFKLIDKLTLADRIKGNAKLSHLMKANANPANTALRPEDMQAKGFSRKEIEGR